MKVCPVRLVAVILSALLFISFLPVNAEQSVSSLSTSVWTQHLGENLLSSVAVKNDTICFEYDDNGYRTSKRTTQGNTTYVYNPDAQLVSEDRGDYLVNYYYDVLGFITGCSINGSNYSYTLDDNRSVVSLLDSTGECVAKYTYAGSKVNVLGKNSQGRWVDKAKDNSFIGNINKITLYSMYFDSETGFFYNGLKYYDAEKNEYLCDPSVSLIVTPMVSQQVAAQVATWQQSLLSSSTFGQAINYTSSWYSNLSDVELLTRLFYGENTQNSYDQNGVTWVVINRKINNYGGGTFRGVATQSGQFEPITGNSSGTTNARVPSTSSPRCYCSHPHLKEDQST
jgi:YD repeat-containing protein